MPIHDLPAPSSLPELGLLPSETVLLYANAAWTGDCFTIKTRKFAPSKRHSLRGLGMQDKATWLAFNLPHGTVGKAWFRRRRRSRNSISICPTPTLGPKPSSRNQAAKTTRAVRLSRQSLLTRPTPRR